jgi:Uma2 family endonuclease
MITQKIYTLEDYYKFTERVAGRFEFADNQIIEANIGEAVEDSLIAYILSDDFDTNELPEFEMPTLLHDILVSNIHILLGLLLKGTSFRPYSQLTAVYAEDKNKNRLPDIVVVKKEEENRNKKYQLLNPIFLIEVLSKSTQKIDQTDKLEEYQGIESVQEYMMVSQDQVKVTIYRRITAKKWEEEIFTELTEKVVIQSLNIELSLKDIYEDVM